MSQDRNVSSSVFDFVAIAKPLAIRLLGEPNEDCSTVDNPRWGNQGSLSLEPKTGVFFDFEAGEGGGVLWLIERELGHSAKDGGAAAWLEAEYLVNGAAPLTPPQAKAAPKAPKAGCAPPKNVKVTETEHLYVDADNTPLSKTVVKRWLDPDAPKGRGKSVYQTMPDGSTPLAKDLKRVPYRLSELLSSLKRSGGIFLIVEGEQKADFLIDEMGAPATCLAGGSSANPGRIDWSAMKGCTALLLPDNDSAGEKLMTKMGAALIEAGMNVAAIDLPDLPAAGDIMDWAESIPDADERSDGLFALIRDAVARARGVPFEPIGDSAPDEEAPPDGERPALEAPAAILPRGSWPLGTYPVPSFAELRTKPAERKAAKLAPRCIVERYWWCDVGLVVGAGGTGKSTLLAYQAIHVALGRDLWGLKVVTPGKVLFVSREDQRERFAARLEAIENGLGLSDSEREIVDESVLFWDLTNEPGAKLIRLKQNAVFDLDPMVDKICERYRDDPPVLIIFDPTTKFGVSEQSVNDNENALIDAARRMVEELKCGVLYVHHISKVNAGVGKADPKALVGDALASRGGSALADGSRSVHVIAGVQDVGKGPPGLPVAAGRSLILLGRPKLSYAPPQPYIWIRRWGYIFDWIVDTTVSEEVKLDADKQKLFRFIDTGVQSSAQLLLTKGGIVAGYLKVLGMTRRQVEMLIQQLTDEAAINPNEPHPAVHTVKGGPRYYLKPTDLGRARYGRPFEYDQND